MAIISLAMQIIGGIVIISATTGQNTELNLKISMLGLAIWSLGYTLWITN